MQRCSASRGLGSSVVERRGPNALTTFGPQVTSLRLYSARLPPPGAPSVSIVAFPEQACAPYLSTLIAHRLSPPLPSAPNPIPRKA
ncbi:BQ5605_C014g07599 [Microbotryum silenes-dioicae]|uniref:BQ5605_C014g07599 protein n=1 Tax=Microbotryum silenes-dioicae TaxID=796604 RepID=A0A2X0MNS3_9BASI|nr:BQ5605_C014g07599 [Microbotryum silenes-dioicae]